MNTTIDFNVLSVFMSFKFVTYLHYYIGSDRTVCIIFSLIPLHNFFTHSTSYYSEFTNVFVTDSQYHECICHRLTVSQVYFFCNMILAEREEASLQTGVGFASEMAD